MKIPFLLGKKSVLIRPCKQNGGFRSRPIFAVPLFATQIKNVILQMRHRKLYAIDSDRFQLSFRRFGDVIHPNKKSTVTNSQRRVISKSAKRHTQKIK